MRIVPVIPCVAARREDGVLEGRPGDRQVAAPVVHGHSLDRVEQDVGGVVRVRVEHRRRPELVQVRRKVLVLVEVTALVRADVR